MQSVIISAMVATILLLSSVVLPTLTLRALASMAPMPLIVDVEGFPVPGDFGMSAGQQVMVSFDFFNNGRTNDDSVIALFEVRNSNITIYMAWQKTTIEPRTTKLIGFSWIPPAAGEYEMLLLTISDLEHPEYIGTNVGYGFDVR
jgi:hypothetical protein